MSDSSGRATLAPVKLESLPAILPPLPSTRHPDALVVMKEEPFLDRDELELRDWIEARGERPSAEEKGKCRAMDVEDEVSSRSFSRRPITRCGSECSPSPCVRSRTSLQHL